MSQGIRREAVGPLGDEERQGAAHMGVFRSGRLIAPQQSWGPQISGAPREQTWAGQGPDDRGPYTGPGDLFYVATESRVRSRRLAPRIQEESRRACRLTGSPWVEPAPVLGHQAPRASTNAHEHRGPLPCPCAFDWTPALALVHRAHGPDGDRVLPLPRTSASLAHTHVQPGVCVGRYEGTEMFLGRRELYAYSL